MELDSWREYTLLEIEDIDRVYVREIVEPIILLKMTCPSTGQIHVLRVPRDITNAEAAITWVNHGVHPDEFAVQT
jgi:leucine-rich repeat protein SHOC2